MITASTIQKKDIVDILVGAGADVNLQDKVMY